MRVLMTFAGGTGHFLPTVPIARALLAGGHQLAYACQQAMVNVVAAQGFTAFGTGGATLLEPSARRPLVRLDRNAERDVVRTSFAGRIAAERVPTLLELAARWRAEVIVRDELDFAAVVAAELLQIPQAAVIVIAAGGLVRPGLVAEPLSALRQQYGLNPDPELLALHPYLTLAPVPPSYRDPGDPLPVTARHLRPAVLEESAAVGDPTEPNIETRDRRPRAYFTLGTIFHQESGDLFKRVLDGIADMPLDVLVSVGSELVPAELGDQPSNVRIVRFAEPAVVLPGCDVVICHGGSGSVLGALAFGVPLVLLPIGADQPLNADRCRELGVARILDSWSATSVEIAEAVADVLADGSYRHNATMLRAEMRALPGADSCLAILEALVR